MKTLWNVLAFMAVVNLLAMAGFVGWLWQSQRLSVDRLEQVRELLKLTIPEQEEADEIKPQAISRRDLLRGAFAQQK